MKEDKKSIFEKYKELFTEAVNDLKTKGKRHKQIPNILTILRLTAPFFILPAAFSGNIPLTIILTSGFGLTDFVDGFIARHWNLTSELGKDLDAVCDKVFAGTLLIAACFTNPILLCNLALEAGIAGINVYKTLKGQEVNSTMIGKYKTWALFSLAGLGLVAPVLNVQTPLNVLTCFTTIMQGLTILSYTSKDDHNKPQGDGENQTEVSSTVIKEEPKEEVQEQKAKIINLDEDKQERKTKYIEELKELREFLTRQQPTISQESVKVKTKI